MNGCDEGSGELCAARNDSPPVLEGAEDIFNDVSCPTQLMIVRSLLFRLLTGRMTAAISASLSISSSSSVPCALSAERLQSATVPLVTEPLAGIPY
jgi:hypothetical protein